MTGQDPFQQEWDVSCETLDRLRQYEDLLRKWNPAINLVARSTLTDIWSRHFLDSKQVFDLAPVSARHWVDLGSGGGFPGMVAAILAAPERPALRFTLVESDQRKAAFLSTAARELGIAVTILAERIETLQPLAADILTARALAPLNRLLAYTERHLSPAGTALFPKGANYAEELKQALENWRFSLQKTESRTDSGAVILNIGGVSRA